jgi:hypothetical protein
MNAQRDKAVRQYIVFHLKLMEVLHLTLLSFHLSDTGVSPDNVMGHGVGRFKETLLGATVSAFISIADNPKSTNILDIWKQLYPRHATAIDRIWARRISAGVSVMKAYRDQAGAHGDRPHKYFAARLALLRDKEQVLMALRTFYELSTCLLKRQAKELPGLASEIEGVLLDIELSFPGGAFNRRWLREMHLIETGRYTKRFT